MAWITGSLSWERTLGWAAICQTGVVLLYVLLQPPPIRSFGRTPTSREIAVLKTMFALGAIVAGIAVAAVLTATTHAFTRR
jgi:hypothetical protein